jgi:osmotically inducible protein OsmC|tara:strand:+ start:2671 stop:3090 length:420 start_codon:yes stop_codon:yes gene_type:complete
MKRKITAIWKGDGPTGTGVLTAQSGAFNNMPYSFKTRFENDNGKLGTNPEELIAAALAGCFNMKLSFVLNESDYVPDELNTDAILTFVDGKIISIELDLKAKVPGLDKEKFDELAEDAKENCPISGALNCEINITGSLV